MDPFWAWIYVEPKSGLENNKSKANEINFHTEELLHVMLKHMYDTYFLPLCSNNGKLSSQEHSPPLFPTTTLCKHLCWKSLTGWYGTYS